ncbi:MAG: DUF2190 family protein [Lachnospiraceae bacterium]|nr:DUF2190 family protein [Lachnospiraceae bacterium]
MSKAAYWQRGESLDYVNNTTAVIEANTIIPIEGRIGVAGTSINPGEKGSLHVVGVYEIAKTSTSEIKMGAAVYFDGNGITDTASGNTPAGYAAQTAAADDAAILVKLMG